MATQSHAHVASRRETSFDKQDPRTGYDHDDPRLRTGEGGVTVWTLQKLLQEKRYDELNELFDNGLTMNSLPVGMSAGAGGAAFDVTSLFPWTLPFANLRSYGYWPVTDIGIDLINQSVSWFALRFWRGKIFFPSDNKRVSEGLNRMRKSVFDPFFLRSSRWQNSPQCFWTVIV